MKTLRTIVEPIEVGENVEINGVKIDTIYSAIGEEGVSEENYTLRIENERGYLSLSFYSERQNIRKEDTLPEFGIIIFNGKMQISRKVFSYVEDKKKENIEILQETKEELKWMGDNYNNRKNLQIPFGSKRKKD